MFDFGASVGFGISKEIDLSICFVIAGQSIHNGRFKHHMYFENVDFEETSNVDSILDLLLRDHP